MDVSAMDMSTVSSCLAAVLLFSGDVLSGVREIAIRAIGVCLVIGCTAIGYLVWQLVIMRREMRDYADQ